MATETEILESSAPPGESSPTMIVGDALSPVQPNERIAVLDILRGFALFGICIINMPHFYSPSALRGAGEVLYPGTLDRAAKFLVDFSGEGKFNSLFSFLFGIGFAIQLDRANAKNAPFVGVYMRRLIALFVIGVVHNLLIWNGDVLHIYAALGVPLIFIRKLRDRWLWLIVVLLLVAPIAWGMAMQGSKKEDKKPPSYYREKGENQLRVFGKGSYDDLLAGFTKSAPKEPRSVVGEGNYWPAVQLRTQETIDAYQQGMLLFWPILGMTLLIGFIVGRRHVFQNLNQHLPRIRKLMYWMGGIGFLLAAGYAVTSALVPPGARGDSPMKAVSMMMYIFNRPFVCAFYVCGIILLSQKAHWQSVLAPLATVGRMPLTNYLLQSVIHGLIFYGYGLGFYARVGPAVAVLIAIGTFAFEVVFSHFWMSKFRFGPMEWFWRTLTYGKPPAMTAPSGS